MSFKRNNITLSSSDWFSANIEYEGQGYAEFIDPQAIVKGAVKIRFDEFGGSSVEMELENHEELARFRTVRHNIACRKLTVTTPKGIFSATEIFSCRFRYETEERMLLEFHLLRSQFEVTDSRLAKYWVLPLSNFLSTFMRRHSDLDRHPLRIYPTPTLPDNLPKIESIDAVPQETVDAILDANRKNHLIYFEFNGSLGFIEPLADYYERQDKLRKGRERHLITAVMVGEVGSNSIDFAHLRQWFPFDFLLLLGLATGTEVGAPWIEFRDEQGELIRRIHVNLRRPFFSEGHVAMRDDIDLKDSSGIGYLLTQSQLSQHYGKPYLRSALEHLVQSGLYSTPLEATLSHLCQALEGLCKVYRITSPELFRDLDEGLKNKVNEILDSAAQQIRCVAAAADNPGQKQKLNQIAERTKTTPKGKAGNFGSYLTELLKSNHFNLHDADIVDAHYQANPRLDNREWSGLLTYYRNAIMHGNYLDEGEYNMEDAVRISRHFYDILLRILFKMLGYDGNYLPTIANMVLQPNSSGCSVSLSFNSPMPVDWVSPDLPASKLGY
jgi:hypothetical protein